MALQSYLKPSIFQGPPREVTLKFQSKLGELQRLLAQCHDMVARRHNLMRIANYSLGESVLDVGCGGGYDALEAAKFVGQKGQVRAIDISDAQVSAARTRCSELKWVRCELGNALELPYSDNCFDVVTFNQVLEYINDAQHAVNEAWRVLKPGGRLLCIGVNISSFVWHSYNKNRMREMLDAWNLHAPHPDLPSVLGSLLRNSQFDDIERMPLPILNTSYRETGFSYWLAQILAIFALKINTVSKIQVNEWMEELQELDSCGEYFFSSSPILTKAIK